ncbi:MAG: tRNA (adenosine(37)-N6)-threonylcarbamoyltransferase complex transferase subunit TsaD [Myxococcales bacterium]|nr:tRNA (adenosine(37)-N6)-threonylcarbamoyltransferase complex transferase subunit TsaD [Myxococcales bacterium]
MLVLGIESSCDETAVAVVRDGREIVTNQVASQFDVHEKYGGVVPELASRSHIVDILPILKAALGDAGLALTDIDGFAVAAGPGLVGSLLVGLEVAKGLAWSVDRPLVGVNHIEAHLTAPLIAYEGVEGLSGEPRFPYVGLVVSGGHTHLYLVEGVGRYTPIGATRDDAAGEAFDKVAKMLGLSYPGGVKIDRLARGGDRAAHRFPRSMMNQDNLEFSFSGIKTAVLTHLRKNGHPELPDSQALKDLCASFQEAVVDVLVAKTFRAARQHGVEDVVISGGVSANSRLRERSLEVATSNSMRVHIPPLSLCTDNAAMIAGLGYHYLRRLEGRGFEAHELNANSRLKMGALPPEA